jgi:hypothetical protein
VQLSRELERYLILIIFEAILGFRSTLGMFPLSSIVIFSYESHVSLASH